MMNRGFKGVWIPKEIWFTKKLSIVEKIMLIEIDSLDNEQGCFASNSYFADFFTLSVSRVSEIITSLCKKKFIKIEYEKNGKQTVKRIIKLINPIYKKIDKDIQEAEGGYSVEGIRKTEEPIRNVEGGYSENTEDNILGINKTISKLDSLNNTQNSFSEEISQVDKNFSKHPEEKKIQKRAVQGNNNPPADFISGMEKFFNSVLPQNCHKYIKPSINDIYKLVRIDGYTVEQIKTATLNAINDDFWVQQFNSPSKLRSKNKEKVMYIDVFLKLKKNKNNNKLSKLGDIFTHTNNKDYSKSFDDIIKEQDSQIDQEEINRKYHVTFDEILARQDKEWLES